MLPIKTRVSIKIPILLLFIACVCKGFLLKFLFLLLFIACVCKGFLLKFPILLLFIACVCFLLSFLKMGTMVQVSCDEINSHVFTYLSF